MSQETDLNSAEEDHRVFSVSEITRDIRSILETAFDTVWIEGEISNYRVVASGHAYFVLKDDKAQIRGVLFRGQRSALKFTPEDGDQVLLLGRVTVYDARGEYQIIVETMEPRGLGALQKAYEQLKEKLSQAGLFDDAHKKPLPEFPWKVGVVTSPTGAAIRDILNIIQRRNPKVSVLLYPVKVQGEGSAEEIATAIKELNRFPDIEVLIIGRGGGSIEDLWAFNEEVVARAVYDSKIPVISAVGHEIDFTIADFVADLRAPTPSAAAELAVPVLAETIEDLCALTEQLLMSMQDQIDDHKNYLKQMIDRRFFREPRQILERPAQRLDEWTQRLLRGLDQWLIVQRERLGGVAHRLLQATPGKVLVVLESKRAGLHHTLLRQFDSQRRLHRQRFEGLAKNLHALSPLSVLDRGYSIATHSGKAIKSSGEVKKGDAVQVRLSKGKLDCTVDETVE